MSKLKKELMQRRLAAGSYKYFFFPEELQNEYRMMEKNKQKLPDGVLRDMDGRFYEIVKNDDLSSEEMTELYNLRKLAYLCTIKNCAIFFVVISVISIIISLVAGIWL